MKLWEGRFTQPSAKSADDFNQSLSFDYKLYWHDILASIAHVKMLGETQIIPKENAEKISDALVNILADIEKGTLQIEGAEDIHTFVENELVRRIGAVGKTMHTARSRNDQVATDLRLYAKDSIVNVCGHLRTLINTLLDIANNNVQYIMPGYTHLRRAQPVSVAQYFNAYSEMFLRDIERFTDCYKRTDVMPLGSCALAGTDFPIDRRMTAGMLSFSEISQNSMDAVSDRDFVAEYIFCCSAAMMHLSRFCEDLILYSSDEFGFIEISDDYSTGSSIMPQKKNPDIPELVRGKTGRVYGDLTAILTVLKGIPLSYDKDLQEDKEAFFDAEDTLLGCLSIFTEMLQHISLDTRKMRLAVYPSAVEDHFLAPKHTREHPDEEGYPHKICPQRDEEVRRRKIHRKDLGEHLHAVVHGDNERRGGHVRRPEDHRRKPDEHDDDHQRHRIGGSLLYRARIRRNDGDERHDEQHRREHDGEQRGVLPERIGGKRFPYAPARKPRQR